MAANCRRYRVAPGTRSITRFSLLLPLDSNIDCRPLQVETVIVRFRAFAAWGRRSETSFLEQVSMSFTEVQACIKRPPCHRRAKHQKGHQHQTDQVLFSSLVSFLVSLFPCVFPLSRLSLALGVLFLF